MNNDGTYDAVSAVITGILKIPYKAVVSRSYRSGSGFYSSGRRGQRVSKRMRLSRGSIRSVSWTVTRIREVPDTSAVSIHLNHGDGTSEEVLGPDISGVFSRLDVGDINGDGIQDVVGSVQGRGEEVLVFYGNGDGTLAEPITIATPGRKNQKIFFNDWNGDDQTDIAWFTTPLDSEILINIMPQTPTTATATTPTAEPAPTSDPAAEPTSGDAPTNMDANAEPAEIEGSITNIGAGFIEVSDTQVWHTSSTVLKFNDVSDFAIGLPVQLKGNWTTDGQIVATNLEIN